jgi:long-subunit acyl-CoA synthetase (AMP-forming)
MSAWDYSITCGPTDDSASVVPGPEVARGCFRKQAVAVDDCGGKQVRRFAILDHDFTEENGELTPTLKIKRNVIYAHYA